ncbi:hypothetical protein ACWY4P_47810 [Streptomyces sp. LZ34]
MRRSMGRCLLPEGVGGRHFTDRAEALPVARRPWEESPRMTGVRHRWRMAAEEGLIRRTA